MNRHVIYCWHGQKFHKLIIIGRSGRAHEYSYETWRRHEYTLVGIVHNKDRWIDKLIGQFEWNGHTVYSER